MCKPRGSLLVQCHFLRIDRQLPSGRAAWYRQFSAVVMTSRRPVTRQVTASRLRSGRRVSRAGSPTRREIANGSPWRSPRHSSPCPRTHLTGPHGTCRRVRDLDPHDAGPHCPDTCLRRLHASPDHACPWPRPHQDAGLHCRNTHILQCLRDVSPAAATRVHNACTIATQVPGPTVATRTVSTTWISATRAPTNGDEP